MWSGFIRRFAGLQHKLELADGQGSDAETKEHGVVYDHRWMLSDHAVNKDIGICRHGFDASVPTESIKNNQVNVEQL